MNRKFNGPSELIMTRNSSVNRFEVTIQGSLAKVDYRMSGNRMIITHTEVPDTLRGKGIAEQLVAFAVKYARKEGLEVVAECEYANRFLNGRSTHRQK
jgi:predicted GNAT family acetyltransferase